MPKMIISVTSFGEKMNNLLPKVLFSLRQQTFQDFKVCLTLNKEDYDNISNAYLKNLLESGEIDLIIAEKHLKPHLKYFYAMQKYKDLPVVTIDDDILLPKTAFEELYNTWIKNPNCVCGRQVFEMRGQGYGVTGSRTIVKDEPANHRFCAEGFASILYPPNAFGEFYNDENELKKIEELLCDDDIYLKGLEIRKGIKVKNAQPKTAMFIRVLDSNNEFEKFSLHKQFNNEKQRTENFNRIANELHSIGY